MKNKFWLMLLFCLFSSNVMANITLFPTAIDFNESARQRSQTLTVINKGDKVQTYRVSLIALEQDENGKYKNVEKTENNADDLLVFSPKQFTLAPGKKQSVRVAFKSLSKVKEGEYVSRLQVREMPMGGTNKTKEEKKKAETAQNGENSEEQKSVSVEIKMYFSASIPVTIYKGKDLLQKTEILSAKQNGDKLNLVFQRKGEISSRFELKVYDDKGEEIAKAGPIRIYTPNGKRNFTVNLKDKNSKAKKIELFDALSKQKIMEKAI